MRIVLLTTTLMVFLLYSCTSESKQTKEKELQLLEGEWLDTKDSTNRWVFNYDEVKWRNYHHFYQLKSDSLVISGLHYRINSKSDDTIQLIDPNASKITLVRIKSDSSK